MSKMPNETVDEMELDRDAALAYAEHKLCHRIYFAIGCPWCKHDRDAALAYAEHERDHAIYFLLDCPWCEQDRSLDSAHSRG